MRTFFAGLLLGFGLLAGTVCPAATSVIEPVLPDTGDILFDVVLDGFELSAGGSNDVAPIASLAIGWVGDLPGPWAAAGHAGDFLVFVPGDGNPVAVASYLGAEGLPDFSTLGLIAARGVGTVATIADVSSGVPVELADLRISPADLDFSLDAQLTLTVDGLIVEAFLADPGSGTVLTIFGEGGLMQMVEDQSVDFDLGDVGKFPASELLTAYQSGNTYHDPSSLAPDASSANTLAVGPGFDPEELLFLSLTNDPGPGESLVVTNIFDGTGGTILVSTPLGLQAVYVNGSTDFGAGSSRTLKPLGTDPVLAVSPAAYARFGGGGFQVAADLAFGPDRTDVAADDPDTYTFQSPPDTGVDFIGNLAPPRPCVPELSKTIVWYPPQLQSPLQVPLGLLHVPLLWEVDICVSPGPEEWRNVNVCDVFGPAFEVALVGADRGEVEIRKLRWGNGTLVIWRIGDLEPCERVCLRLRAITTTNWWGLQQFVSPGCHLLNWGAWLKGKRWCDSLNKWVCFWRRNCPIWIEVGSP